MCEFHIDMVPSWGFLPDLGLEAPVLPLDVAHGALKSPLGDLKRGCVAVAFINRDRVEGVRQQRQHLGVGVEMMTARRGPIETGELQLNAKLFVRHG